MYNFDYNIVKDYKLYSVVRPLAGFVSRVVYKVSYSGLENIPQGGNYIIASNHLSALDPVFIGNGCKANNIHFIAKNELFENKIIGFFLKHMNSFPVDREKLDLAAFDYASKIVNSGGILGIFPEGTRSLDNKPQKGKGGVGLVAKKCCCDVLPVSIYCKDDIKKGSRIKIRFGKIIKYDELQFDQNSTKFKDVRYGSQLIMTRISELWEIDNENTSS